MGKTIMGVAAMSLDGFIADDDDVEPRRLPEPLRLEKPTSIVQATASPISSTTSAAEAEPPLWRRRLPGAHARL